MAAETQPDHTPPGVAISGVHVYHGLLPLSLSGGDLRHREPAHHVVSHGIHQVIVLLDDLALLVAPVKLHLFRPMDERGEYAQLLRRERVPARQEPGDLTVLSAFETLSPSARYASISRSPSGPRAFSAAGSITPGHHLPPFRLIAAACTAGCSWPT